MGNSIARAGAVGGAECKPAVQKKAGDVPRVSKPQKRGLPMPLAPKKIKKSPLESLRTRIEGVELPVDGLQPQRALGVLMTASPIVE